MYQSSGMFDPDSPSFGTRKWTISGESPVAVSCVRMQVSISSTPVFQSRSPLAFRCLVCGGIETGWTAAPVVTAPSISEPPKKQIKWSCLG